MDHRTVIEQRCAADDAVRLPGSFAASPTWAKPVNGISLTPNTAKDSAKGFIVLVRHKALPYPFLKLESFSLLGAPLTSPSAMKRHFGPALLLDFLRDEVLAFRAINVARDASRGTLLKDDQAFVVISIDKKGRLIQRLQLVRLVLVAQL